MDKEGKMSVTGHLAELRKRLLFIVFILVLLFVIAFTYSEYLVDTLITPIEKDLRLSLDKPYLSFVDKPQKTQLVFLAPAEALWMNIKVSMVAAFLLSVPVILLEIWLFIKPALKKKERKYFIPFITSGTSLFFVGVLFCFIIVLPFAMQFLLTYKTGKLTAMISIGNYMDFTMKFMLAFGFVFELPIVMTFLTKMGFITPDKLARSRKYALVLAFVVAALLTPTPDAFNQTLMAVPIIILYEAGIWASRFFYTGKDKKDKQALQAKEDE